MLQCIGVISDSCESRNVSFSKRQCQTKKDKVCCRPSSYTTGKDRHEIVVSQPENVLFLKVHDDASVRQAIDIAKKAGMPARYAYPSRVTTKSRRGIFYVLFGGVDYPGGPGCGVCAIRADNGEVVKYKPSSKHQNSK